MGTESRGKGHTEQIGYGHAGNHYRHGTGLVGFVGKLDGYD